MLTAKYSAQIIIDDFSYAALPPEQAEFLRQKAARINARRHITHTLIEEMGRDLLETKERLPGVFLQWARAEFQFSDDTIENYINVAKRLPAMPEGTTAPIQARALYLLSRESTPDAARQEAQELAASGVPVDYKTAFILANAPPELKARYVAEELPKESAYELTKVLGRRTLSPEVKQICLDQKVSAPELVTYLDQAYRDYERTAGTTYERLTFKDIERDNWTLNGLGWSVKLGEARVVDIERYKVDRAQMHKDNAPRRYQWLITESTLQEAPDGSLYLQITKSDFDGLESGQLLTVQIRLPISGD